MKSKTRFSFPGKVYELMLSDDKFYQDVCKLRPKIENSFPKNDQFRDEHGFHMSFALAGYSPEDVHISAYGRVLSLSADGLESIEEKPAMEALEEELEKDYNKPAKISVYKGSISRGIARRPFKTQFYISEEFDLSKIEADMKNGLLHIFIPEAHVETIEVKIIKGE